MSIVLTMAALTASVVTGAAPEGRAGTTVIRGAAIVDVERGRLIEGRDIVIADGVIAAIAKPGESPRGAGVVDVDGAGLFAMPGLFDAHVHLMGAMDTDPILLVAHGVTGARDLGGLTQAVVELKRAIAAGERIGPDLVVTGAIIDGDPPVWPFSEIAATPEAGRAAVQRLQDAGVDMIKVYSRLTKEAYEAVVAEAHARGLKVTGHIPESVTLDEALTAGQDCNEHLMRIEAALYALAGEEEPRDRAISATLAGWSRYDAIPQQTLNTWAKSLAAKGMMQCPTVVVMRGIGRTADPEAKNDPMLAYVGGQMRAYWASEAYANWGTYAGAVVPTMQKTVKLFHDNGVPMMIGTDLGNPYVFAGRAVHEEMALWQEAGVPAPAILKAATIIPATFCDLGESHGVVKENRVANLVLVRKDPLLDIRHAAEIEHVFLRGAHYDRAALAGMLEDVRTLIAEADAAPSEVADAPVGADLPGKEVARGVYRMAFGEFDAGTEQFVITETEDAYHLRAEIRPRGGGQVPSSVTARSNKRGELRSVEWTQHSSPVVTATYEIEGDTLKATATKGGELQPAQMVEFTERHILSLPAIAGAFMECRALSLRPGETKELTVLSFGFPDWRTQPSAYKVSRFDAATIEVSGVAMECAHYLTETVTPIGVFKSESWLDENALPYRAVITMPFGVVTFERE